MNNLRVYKKSYIYIIFYFYLYWYYFNLNPADKRLYKYLIRLNLIKEVWYKINAIKITKQVKLKIGLWKLCVNCIKIWVRRIRL